MLEHHQDAKGISVPETRDDYERFDDPVSSRPGCTPRPECPTAT